MMLFYQTVVANGNRTNGESMNVKEERKKLGVSQMRLSIQTGVSKYVISLHECGYKGLTMRDLKKISKALEELKKGNVGGQDA